MERGNLAMFPRTDNSGGIFNEFAFFVKNTMMEPIEEKQDTKYEGKDEHILDCLQRLQSKDCNLNYKD